METTNWQQQLEKVKDIEHLRQEDLFLLNHPRRSVSVTFPLLFDDGHRELVEGYRVQYNDALGPTKGGIRFDESVSQEEVTELAFLMSLKTALLNLPFGGAKGGVKIDSKRLSTGEKERLSRGYVRAMRDVFGPNTDIPAPDMHTNAQTMNWMMDEMETLTGEKAPGSFTGKSWVLGGSLGRPEATGRGAFHVLKRYYMNRELKGLRFAIQGFGNAGAQIASLIYEEGGVITALSDSSGGIRNEKGLDLKEVITWKQEQGTLATYPHAEKITSETVLKEPVDVLIPAAMGNVITTENVDSISATAILELANAPVSAAADTRLNKQGQPVLPDILVNAGGVVVSYFEWVQNRQQFYWSLESVHEALAERMHAAFDATAAFAEKEGCSYRTAAYALAIERILNAERYRGNR